MIIRRKIIVLFLIVFQFTALKSIENEFVFDRNIEDCIGEFVAVRFDFDTVVNFGYPYYVGSDLEYKFCCMGKIERDSIIFNNINNFGNNLHKYLLLDNFQIKTPEDEEELFI
jgi:hypothetical protein